MNRTSRTVIAALFAAQVATSAMIAADLTIVSTTSSGGETSTTTQYFTNEKMRFRDGQSDLIIDAGTGRTISIDHEKKTYTVVDHQRMAENPRMKEAKARYEQMMAEMAKENPEAAEMMKNHPMAQRMLGQPVDVTVEKLGGNRKIAGYPCTQYRVTVEAGFSSELWVTDRLALPTGYYDAFKTRFSNMGPIAASYERLYDAMEKIDGVPLASTMRIKALGITSESTATSVTVGKLPAETFDEPPYRKTELPFR